VLVDQPICHERVGDGLEELLEGVDLVDGDFYFLVERERTKEEVRIFFFRGGLERRKSSMPLF
jgi:hypothetical protein